MKTAAQREEEFRKDLAKLLKRHGAELEITEEPHAWETIPYITIFMNAEWDDNGDAVKEYAEFNLWE